MVRIIGVLTQFNVKQNYKIWYNLKILCEYWWFFSDFWVQTVLISPDQNVSIPLDQNVSILLGSNMYNGNIRTFWHRTLWRLGIVQNLCEYCWIFRCVFLGQNCADTPNIHTVDISILWLPPGSTTHNRRIDLWSKRFFSQS